jgi:hypothetical protein
VGGADGQEGGLMRLSWSDIKTRALAFSQAFEHARDEKSQAQTFWFKFFDVFGVDSSRVGVFESRVKKLNKRTGFADFFWPGLLLIEHKSRGENLEIATDQAADYCVNLKEGEHPRYLLVCDFQHFWLKDLTEGTELRFELRELSQHVSRFAFILGQQSSRIQANDPINDHAVKKLARLHTALRRDGYKRHPLQLLLVRLLFCLFADKTGLFEPAGRFTDLLERGTLEDGSNVGQVLNQLFDELDTELSERQGKLPGWFKDFPYVNGQLFEEKIRTASFDAHMRGLLLDCCDLDWARISPAIFGSMFQHIMDAEGLDSQHDLRRELGAHYTSEENIFKLIKPMFLDGLEAELEQAQGSINALFEFQKKLRRLRFFDPACGCGNFLVITYRELRRLELAVFDAVKVQALRRPGTSGLQLLVPFRREMVNVDQFSGIEIEEFPARVAQVAMWLVDHQMNMLASETLEAWLPRLPLAQSARIRVGNALDLDWAEFCPPEQTHYILGNPPFVGKQMQSPEQKDVLERLMAGAGIQNGGVLDFVAAWYIKAAQYLSGSAAAQANERKKAFKDAEFAKAQQASLMDENPASGRNLDDVFDLIEAQDLAEREKIKVAFVSTNSICQGEQVGILWSWMAQQGIAIEFAHRTFKWSNEASGNAAVHCVIVGFGLKTRVDTVQPKRLVDYLNDAGENDPTGEPHEERVTQINPYLVDAPQVVLPKRRQVLCSVSPVVFGSMPNDGGHLLLSEEERTHLLAQEPKAKPFVRRFLGAEEFINNLLRYCLWLKDIQPQTLAALPLVRARVAQVKKHRLASNREATKKLAADPRVFGEDRQPVSGHYLLIPRVSSERRAYIPIGFLSYQVVASDATLIVPNATLFEFAILTSAMHMAWMRYTCGRLKSDYRYSASIVYNNFPWPVLDPNNAKAQALRQDMERAAQAVLDTRAAHQRGDQPASLAMLYASETMPTDLRLAHRALDALVDKAYLMSEPANKARGRRLVFNDTARVALLFDRYQALVLRLAESESQAQADANARVAAAAPDAA